MICGKPVDSTLLLQYSKLVMYVNMYIFIVWWACFTHVSGTNILRTMNLAVFHTKIKSVFRCDNPDY